MKIWILIFSLIGFCNLVSADKLFILKGKVVDSDSKEPLPSVTVKVLNTKKGAYTNTNGEYLIKLPRGKYNVRVSMVGHETIEQEINLVNDTTNWNFGLAIAKMDAPELEVYADDPLTRLIKRLLKKKQLQKDSLESYKYTLYTKFVFATDTLTAGRTDNPKDTTINSILESFSEGYYKKKDNYFNRIFQKRQSVNVPPQANFVAFGTNINAYDDFVNILSEDIATPFHPDALDFYTFEVVGTFKSDKKTRLTRIKVTPKTIARRLFSGYINIDEEREVPASVELEPNIAVQLPLGATLKYNQDFEQFEDKYIMPTRMRIFSTSKVDILWIFSPRLDILIETAAFDYKINPELPSDLFDERRVEIIENANNFDTLYWANNQLVQLREDEQQAYAQILTARDNPDSVQGSNFFTQYLAPINRFFARFNRAPFTGLEDIFKYNRVSGLTMGLGLKYSPQKTTDLSIWGGGSFADERFYGESRLVQYFDDKRKYGIDINYFDKLARRDKGNIIPSRAITFLSSLFKSDYGDYYYSKGFEAGLTFSTGQLVFLRRDNFTRPYLLRFFLRDELQTSAENSTNFSLFSWKSPFRPNPPINDGHLRSAGFQLGVNYTPERRISNAGFYFEFENSSHVLGSAFTFRQYYFEGNIKFPTLPLWSLDLKVMAGYSEQNAPAQRYFSNESSSANIVASGAFRAARIKEFYGDRFIAANFEHNFGEIFPGLFRIPNIAAVGLEIIGIFNTGWFDFSPQAKLNNSKLAYNYPSSTVTNDNIYYEAGIGINRILFFFRLDLTTRLTQTTSPSIRLNITGATD